MHPLAAAALAVVALVAIAFYARKRKEAFLIYPYLDMAEDGYNGNPYALSECRGNRDSFRGALRRFPYNIQLYDYPYKYPHYAGRNEWDFDKRCRTNCGELGCTVWCR